MGKAALYRELGSAIATARKADRRTQAWVAKRAGMGRATLANIEAGRQRIAVHQLLAIAGVLPIRVEALRALAVSSISPAPRPVDEVSVTRYYAKRDPDEITPQDVLEVARSRVLDPDESITAVVVVMAGTVPNGNDSVHYYTGGSRSAISLTGMLELAKLELVGAVD